MIWTDVVQASVMVAGMIVVIVAGTNESGGIQAVIDALKRSGRWELL